MKPIPAARPSGRPPDYLHEQESWRDFTIGSIGQLMTLALAVHIPAIPVAITAAFMGDGSEGLLSIPLWPAALMSLAFDTWSTPILTSLFWTMLVPTACLAHRHHDKSRWLAPALLVVSTLLAGFGMLFLAMFGGLTF